MSCERCNSIKMEIKIPQDLTEAIRLVKLKISGGTIKYCGAGPYGEPFSKIDTGKTWSDIINNYFCCTSCQQIISLHAETYHGSGGKLEPVDKVEGELSDNECS